MAVPYTFATATSNLPLSQLDDNFAACISGSAPSVNATLNGFTTTATAAGTTVLTNTSSVYQLFTGTTTQTITLPVVTTLAQGWVFHIINNSTGNLTVNSSGSNLVITVLAGTAVAVTCILATGTTAASWEAGYIEFSTATGTGSVVLSNSPTLVTPALGTPASGVASNMTVDGTNAIGFKNIPAVGTKTGSYTLAVADVGKYVQVGTGGSITIPDATFAEGDVISLFNNTTGNITITCTITTAYIGGVNTDKATVTLATRGVATILFISSTLCVINGNVS